MRRAPLGALLTGILALALLVVPPAAASVATPARGDFRVTGRSAPTLQPTPDGRCLIRFTATFRFEGTLAGAFTAPFTILDGGACDQPAAQSFVAHGTFSGSVAGRHGSFSFVFTGTIDAAENARGALVVLAGTGDLQGLRGALELSGRAGVGGSYRGLLMP